MARDPYDFYAGNQNNSALKFVTEQFITFGEGSKRWTMADIMERLSIRISREIVCGTCSSRVMQIARASAVKTELML